MNRKPSIHAMLRLIGCVVLLLLLMCAAAYAEGKSTIEAPTGYAPQNTFLQQKAIPRSEALPRVLLIEDQDPWDTTSNQQVLGKITAYDKVTTREFLDVDLKKYGVVVFANDQPFSTYENYADFKEQLEVFASIGGVIVFGACDAGWADGTLIEALPGNVTKKTHYVTNNYVVNSTHPIVTGVLTDNKVLTSDMLYDQYCSHVSFDESSLPAGSSIILRESDTDRPTLVEYPLGQGRVIASGLTWEFSYQYHLRGEYALTAMEDMYRYAIRVSSIDVDELYLLDQMEQERESHAVIVVEAGLDLKNLKPIAGATVKIDGKTYNTDADGTVLVSDFGKKTVTVTADNYTTNEQEYSLEPCTSRIIYMDREPVADKPVLLRASVTYPLNASAKDVRSQIVHIPSGSDYVAVCIFKADWKGHGEGTYRLYQGSNFYEPDHHVDIPHGAGTFDVGNYFSQDKQMKMVLIAKDGTVSDPINLNIYIDEPRAETVNEKNSIEWLGRNKALTTGDVFFTLVSNLVLDVVGESLPIDMKLTDNEDGSTTYRFLIGITKGEAEKIWKHTKDGWEVQPNEDDDGKFFKSAWHELKDKIDGVKKAGGFGKAMKDLKNNIMSKWDNAKPSKVSVEAARKLEVDFMGYIENTFLDGKVTSVSGGVFASGAASGTIGNNFMAGPVPMYLEFTIDGKVEASLGAGMEQKSGVWGPKLDFKGIELQLLGLKMGIGAGVRNVATIGGWGKGEFVLTFLDPSAAAKVKGDITFSGGLEAKILWVIDWEQTIAKKTWQLFPKNNKAMARMLSAPTVSLASRSYLKNETAWNQSALGAIAKSAGMVQKTLKSGVMPDAIPQLYQVGDRLIMLYLEDDAAREMGSHTRLMYSVNTAGAWSEPVPVWESTTADYFYDCAVVDGKLHVIWQKARAEMTIDKVEGAAEQLAKNSEICYAVWSADAGFTQQQYLTDNDTFDMLPAVAAGRGSVYAVWANNAANDIYGIEGANTINAVRIRNGKPETVRKVDTVQEQLLELSAGLADNELHVLYAALNDSDETVLRHVDNRVHSVESGAQASALEFVNGEFVWQENGALYRYDPDKRSAKVLLQYDSDAVSANFQYLTNGSNKAVVWFEENDGTVSILASVPSGSGWSLPAVLAEFTSDAVAYNDAVLLDNGNFGFILNTARRDADGNVTATALKYIVATPTLDVELQDVTLGDPNWLEKEQTVNLLLKNNGMKSVDRVRVTMKEGSTVYLDQELRVNLQPGEEMYAEANLDLRNVLAVVDTTVNVDAAGDVDLADNSRTLTIGHVDVQLALDTYERNNNIMFVFSIVNNSTTAANAALSIIEDQEDGIVIDVKNIGRIERENYIQYLYVLDKADIDYDAKGHKTYFFKVDTLEADLGTSDNLIQYTVTRSPSDHTHKYNVVEFHWSEDYATCDVTVECEECGVQTTTMCTVTSETFPATNTADGKVVYTAVMTYEDQTFMDTQTVILPAIELPDTGDHSQVELWLSVMAVTSLLMLALVIRGRKHA